MQFVLKRVAILIVSIALVPALSWLIVHAQKSRPSDFAFFDSTIYLTLLLGAMAIVLSLVVPFAVGRNRNALARLFGPTVRIVTLAVGLAVILQGILVAATIIRAETQTLGSVHFNLVLILGGGGILVGIAVLMASLAFLKRPPMPVLGHTLVREEEPSFFTFLDGLARRLGASPPDHVVVGLEPTFYVTSEPISLAGSDKILHGETLYLSLPLCRVLKKEELAAVIGHELGHFLGKDTAYSRKFAPAFVRLGRTLTASQAATGWGALYSIPVQAILGLCLYEFSKAASRISREREFEADIVGVRAASPMDLGAALLKVGLYSPLWSDVLSNAVAGSNEEGTQGNLSAFFQHYCSNTYTGVKGHLLAVAIDEGEISHPIDTHPPISARLDHIGVKRDMISAEILGPDWEDRSVGLFHEANAYEEELSALQRQQLVAGAQTQPPDGAARQS
ncbi:M48 family metalloprotease [Labrys neptuniae]|uniref:M48 family metallopeptidase n=1 Tax=Labrys neptuniae TaxID=376174 RepID=UPI00288EB89A|nr:M48 family metalloprotease [Labrys neptuniae]MDT3379579.1 M48 family metalloprotease [Labrys neptuniae]